LKRERIERCFPAARSYKKKQHEIPKQGNERKVRGSRLVYVKNNRAANQIGKSIEAYI